MSARHLVSIDDLSTADIEGVLATADSMSAITGRTIKKVPALRGRTVLNVFYEASTRTQTSFELAATRLSADVLTITATGSSVEKGECLRDTVQTLCAYDPSMLVLRHPQSGAVAQAATFAERYGVSVINAGDGAGEHPTQALLDLHALRARVGDLTGLRIVIVGDVRHSRVAASGLRAWTRMGCRVRLAGPPELLPETLPPDSGLLTAGARPSGDTLSSSGASSSCDDALSSSARPGTNTRPSESGNTLPDETSEAPFLTLAEALQWADVVYCLRLQSERMLDKELCVETYAREWQITEQSLRSDQLLMHPGPINRGVEMNSTVADDPRSLVLSQVRSGVAVRAAVLYHCALDVGVMQ